MSKINNAFKNGKAFIAFLTAGDPSLEKTEQYILTMEKSGADLIEIGIPFSDPIAEGKVIERANIRALNAGTPTDKIFDMVQRVRQKTDVPLVFLTYLNPVFSYGYEKFFQKCRAVGIDGIIIPDLPFEEKIEILPYANENEVDLISLIAPTSEDRISMIAQQGKGFIYVVSSMGVTGVRKEITTDLQMMMQTIKAASNIPICVGFGISTPEQVKEISNFCDGVIVGSAIVKIIEEYGQNAEAPLANYVAKMKRSLN
ncbi:tryptophan synthase subunit alpha [Anaerotignum sp. MB30-C6]|uniref:tryptophan synthase subunit alpha n=1 Tax=Anaerotignum sp. MB30-C6 TaxID=3070814 RepID=UPI0027DD9E93|nr:tryptophan synthase subunit alpha [Anaerotignum sp. MB30-C6]WMI82616.1 tryptophan synthase subunit alpha [Anaerotignum sp. MB30-C6]